MSFLFDIFCSRGIKSSLKSGFFLKFKPGEHLVTFFCSNALHGLTVLFHGKICALCCNKRQCYSGEKFSKNSNICFHCFVCVFNYFWRVNIMQGITK